MKKHYHCGMYGGSFNPLHMGHVRCMIQAANMCDRLIVVISYSQKRNEVDIRQRYRWVYETLQHFPHAEIFTLEDDAPTKTEYTENTWYTDAEKVKAYATEKIDAVFFGNDYAPDSIWTKCYPDAEAVIFSRDEISSTEIRKAPLKHWDWIPSNVRPYYVKKILLMGVESTGKSTLSTSLARYYNTVWLEEVGRDISARSGKDAWMLPEDYTDILLRHKDKETQMIQQANRILFEDTDCLTTLFFMEFFQDQDFDKQKNLAEAIAKMNQYDLVLLLGPQVPFVQDGDRSMEIANHREQYTERIREICIQHGIHTVKINGDYQERFIQSVKLIDEMLKEESM